MALLLVSLIAVKGEEEQSPLDLALKCASTFYRSGGVDVACYLIMNCGCGGEVEKIKLLCGACYYGKLNLVKKLALHHKLHPNCELYKKIVPLCCLMYDDILHTCMCHKGTPKHVVYNK